MQRIAMRADARLTHMARRSYDSAIICRNEPTVVLVSEAVDDDADRPRDFVRSLERGLAIIRTFSAERPELTVSELADETGLTRAAVRRFVLTLSEMGYVHSKHNRFELAPRMLELGYAYLSALHFPEASLGRVEELVAETGESSEAAILDGDEVVYVLRVPGPSQMTIGANIGARAPAYATSLGRVLLAYLPPDQLDSVLAHAKLTPILPRTIVDTGRLRDELERVRRQGYALVDQELEAGLVAVAVPVRDRFGRVRAALNLSTHIGRRNANGLLAALPELRAAADAIEVELRDVAGWQDY